MDLSFSRLKGELGIILTIVELEVRRLRHDYTDIAVRAIQPIVWLLVFGTIMSQRNVIPTPGGVSTLPSLRPAYLRRPSCSLQYSLA
jgi:ABC-2 type transport system permease protein